MSEVSILLLIVFVFSILVIEEWRCARVFMLVSTAGHVALFPLLYQPAGEILYVLCLKTHLYLVHTFLPH